MINPIERLISEKQECVLVGRGLLNRMYGGVTREVGFARELTDDQVIAMCLDSGYEIKDGAWQCKAVEQARVSGMSASEIWG